MRLEVNPNDKSLTPQYVPINLIFIYIYLFCNYKINKNKNILFLFNKEKLSSF